MGKAFFPGCPPIYPANGAAVRRLFFRSAFPRVNGAARTVTAMQDLNDLRFFAAVAGHGGFSAAARALGLPKSRLSKRIAAMEARMGVRLLERSTRATRPTALGAELLHHCETVLAGAEAAEAAVARARAAPAGLLRVACPPGLAPNIMAAILPGFLRAHPLVRVELVLSNRPVDLVEDRFDVALRVRSRLDDDPALVMRRLGESRLLLVGAPSLLGAAGLDAAAALAALRPLPTLSMAEGQGPETWRLHGPDGAVAELRHEPRLRCADFALLRDAAIAGTGMALLPDYACRAPLADGRLVHLLPDWAVPRGTVHLVFTGRRGLLPSVRAFVDHVAREFPRLHAACQERAT